MKDREGAEPPRPSGAKSPTRRKPEPPRDAGDKSPGMPASVRMHVRIPRDLHRRWETWCAWHRANPSEEIALFLESKTRGFVVQQRPNAPAEGTAPECPPIDDRIAG